MIFPYSLLRTSKKWSGCICRSAAYSREGMACVTSLRALGCKKIITVMRTEIHVMATMT